MLAVAAPPEARPALGGEPTLDELIVGAWEALAGWRAVACPVCGSDMTRQDGAQAQQVRARCDGCGATLS